MTGFRGTSYGNSQGTCEILDYINFKYDNLRSHFFDVSNPSNFPSVSFKRERKFTFSEATLRKVVLFMQMDDSGGKKMERIICKRGS